MKPVSELRLRFALPFAVLPGPGSVHLVAGEDVRFQLEAPALDSWLPDLLAGMDGRTTSAELVARVPEDKRPDALELLARLLAERVLEPTGAAEAHRAAARRLALEGAGQVRAALEARPVPDASAEPLRVFCQSELDYAALAAFNADCLRGTVPFLWVSTGPLSRSFVGPVCLPDAGPCLACLVSAFRRLSPVPDLYDVLASGERAWPTVEVPASVVEVVSAFVRWKAELLRDPAPSAALFRLHVVEHATLEVSSHRVPMEPECAACGELR